MIGASPRLISSTISSFGFVVSARAIASICCSPPESRPARRSSSRSRAGKYSSARSRSDEPFGRAEARFSCDRQLEEQRPILGHVGEPVARDEVRPSTRRPTRPSP